MLQIYVDDILTDGYDNSQLTKSKGLKLKKSLPVGRSPGIDALSEMKRIIIVTYAKGMAANSEDSKSF